MSSLTVNNAKLDEKGKKEHSIKHISRARNRLAAGFAFLSAICITLLEVSLFLFPVSAPLSLAFGILSGIFAGMSAVFWWNAVEKVEDSDKGKSAASVEDISEHVSKAKQHEVDSKKEHSEKKDMAVQTDPSSALEDLKEQDGPLVNKAEKQK